jgi:hypothetical protein
MTATSASVTLSSNFPHRSLKIQIANIEGSADDVVTGLLKLLCDGAGVRD